MDATGKPASGLPPCKITGRHFYEHVESGICPDTPNRFNLSPEELAALSPPRPAVQPEQPIPRSEWPPRIQKIARLAEPSDKGIGSLMARLIASNDARMEAARIIADEFGTVTTINAAFVWATGGDCGCADRVTKLDAKYPLA